MEKGEKICPLFLGRQKEMFNCLESGCGFYCEQGEKCGIVLIAESASDK